MHGAQASAMPPPRAAAAVCACGWKLGNGKALERRSDNPCQAHRCLDLCYHCEQFNKLIIDIYSNGHAIMAAVLPMVLMFTHTKRAFSEEAAFSFSVAYRVPSGASSIISCASVYV